MCSQELSELHFAVPVMVRSQDHLIELGLRRLLTEASEQGFELVRLD